ncbi:ABC transporter ATP-binding protein [Paenibacillus sp. MMS18-CY102]|uniref:ABC transporter ATP-binding protein n=1 Tax=Paenibacillus sp. MMS18-CY102 TaxID=2682849 RepID=UPI0013663766|nr:ABC transporter ATP-binding protein [Paenibacillus sp. MMS18-CY102]MWC29466.1 ATP-binding cassette domain-containing protein [Paenibacillus sp. MMS18-CY102]
MQHSARPIISFESVGKKFRRKEALRRISLELAPGQIIGVIGTNGSGKSTLLKLIAGLLQPSSGQVHVNGKQVTRLTARDVAFLPDQDVFYEEFDLGRTVDFYASVYEDFDLQKAHELMEAFGLEPRQHARRLSKGNRGRFKIVLALARRAPLIVMDEPLSGLDPLVRESIIHSIIANIDLEKQTLVLSTHEVDEVEPLLDRVLLISNGELRGSETVEQIHAEYATGLVGWMKQQLAGK